MTPELCARHVCDDALLRVFALLGKRWSGLIIGVLLQGPARYAELARSIPGISERMLSNRLGELIDAGLVSRAVEDGPPLAVSYRLTRRGEGLRPGLDELRHWARRSDWGEVGDR